MCKQSEHGVCRQTFSLAFHSAREASKRPSGSSPPKGLYCSRAASSCRAAFLTMDDLSSSRPARARSSLRSSSAPAGQQELTKATRDL